MNAYFSRTMRRGFTLVELLTVVSIIIIMSGIVYVSVGAAMANSRDKTRVGHLAQIQLALKLYEAQNGAYPPEAEYSGSTIDGTICASCSGPINEVIKQYGGEVPEDPSHDSNGPYLYYYDGSHKCGGSSRKAVLIAKTMQTEGYKNMVDGPCDNGNPNTDYGEEGRGSNNLDAYYVILGPASI